MYSDDSWEKFRCECLEYMRDKENALVKKWLDSINYTEPVGYYMNIGKQEIEIYATKVGVLIGRAGVGVDKLKEILTEEFNGEWNVKFIEIRGSFVNV